LKVGGPKACSGKGGWLSRASAGEEIEPTKKTDADGERLRKLEIHEDPKSKA